MALLECLPSQTGSPPANERQLAAARLGERNTVHQAKGDRLAVPAEVRPRPPDVTFFLDEVRPRDADVGRKPRVCLRRAGEVVRALLARRTVPALLIEPTHTAHYRAERCSETRQIPAS